MRRHSIFELAGREPDQIDGARKPTTAPLPSIEECKNAFIPKCELNNYYD